MDIRRITIRVPLVLHQQLHEVANDQDVSLNTLAVKALEAYVEESATAPEKLPLRELGALLAPAAEASELTEEELLRYARQVRRRVWKERYEKAAQAIIKQQESL